MAAVPHAFDFPVVQVSAYELGVAGDEVEGQIHLRSVELCHKVQETFSHANALVVRQNHKAADAEIVRFHARVDNGDEGNWSILVFGDVASDSRAQGAV